MSSKSLPSRCYQRGSAIDRAADVSDEEACVSPPRCSLGRNMPDIGLPIHGRYVRHLQEWTEKNYATLRPTAGAIMRSSSISLAN